jgi:hypothetical protein
VVTTWLRLVWLVVALPAVTGCKSLFPAVDHRTKSPWQNMEEVQCAYDEVVPKETQARELRHLGFDPYTNPNVKVLNYLDIMQRFLINPSIRKEDLPESLQEGLASKDACYGYELEVSMTRSKRYGNLFLDMTGFKRKTHETGWNFKALVVLKDDVVIYKIWSGQPQVDKYEANRKPLGPFQDIEGLVRALPSGF